MSAIKGFHVSYLRFLLTDYFRVIYNNFINLNKLSYGFEIG